MNNIELLSKKRRAVKEAFDKGYRVVNGEVIYNGNKRKLQIENRKETDYYCFNVRVSNGIGERLTTATIMVHNLLAYQKFGDEFLFSDSKKVRALHIDNNSLNNSEDNIALGTYKEIRQKMPIDVTKSSQVAATAAITKHNHEEIIKFHDEFGSYKKTMEKFGVTKGTLHFILKKSLSKKHELI